MFHYTPYNIVCIDLHQENNEPLKNSSNILISHAIYFSLKI